LWVTSCEEALGWEPGTFLDVYARNRSTAMSMALSVEPIVKRLRQLSLPWEGTASELLADLNSLEGVDTTKRLPEGWPKNAPWLSKHLLRLAPALRATGLVAVRTRMDALRTWHISQARSPDQEGILLSLPSYRHEPLKNNGLTHDSNMTVNDGKPFLPSWDKSLNTKENDSNDSNDGIFPPYSGDMKPPAEATAPEGLLEKWDRRGAVDSLDEARF
ncbi:MAG: hypothetical protein ACREXR_18170, partial [Gammaproteobacteria bacterium]